MFKTIIHRFFLAATIMIPLFALADEETSCVKIKEVNKPEHSCKNPNPFLGIFFKGSVTFFVIENECNQAVRVLSTLILRGKKYVGERDVLPKQQGTIVNCGKTAEPLGWCYKPEPTKSKCSGTTLRKFGEAN